MRGGGGGVAGGGGGGGGGTSSRRVSWRLLGSHSSQALAIERNKLL